MNCLIEKDGLKLYVLRQNSSTAEMIITSEQTVGESLAVCCICNLIYENVFEFYTTGEYHFSLHTTYEALIKEAIKLLSERK